MRGIDETFRERQEFLGRARDLIRLPRPGEAPLDHLLPEARWQELICQAPDPGEWLMALSQATGVYFFPSREWVPRFIRYLSRLKIRRLLEAGAGRGYLSAALAPLAQAAGMTFKAIDKGQGEYQAGMPVHPRVERGDVFKMVPEFRPDLVFYAWPPPNQSLAPLVACPSRRWVVVAGEAGGGTTGAREDWINLPHKKTSFLSQFSRGRTGPGRHQVTIFWSRGGG